MGRRNQLDIGALARAGVFEEVRGVASYKSLDIAGMAAEVRRLFSTQASLASQPEFALVGLTVVFRQKCAKWLQGLTRIHDRMLGVYLTAAEKRRAHELLRDTIEFGVPKRLSQKWTAQVMHRLKNRDHLHTLMPHLTEFRMWIRSWLTC